MMKKTIGSMLMGLCAASALNAQSPVTVERQSVQRSGSDLVVNMRVDISNMELGRNRTVVCTPLLEKGDSLLALPPVVVNGRTRQIAYERRDGAALVQPGEVVVWRKNRTEQKVDYLVKVPFRAWMNRADVSMVTDLCGCGWKALQNDKSHLFAVNLEVPVVKPVPAFLAPAAEEVKRRALNGQAYLDFPVNSIVIRPDYRKNPGELAAIRSTIEAVENNKNATITHVSIKGFASPEGTYANNERLAEGRAEALLGYVKELYDFSGVPCDVASEPEDWQGLETRLAASDIEGREEALAIIRADEPADPDAREWKLKQLPAYRQILADIYPALRRSDYVVEYNIRNFTLEEARDIIAIEHSGAWKGLYHVLGGVISPMDGVGPDQLHIKELLARIDEEGIEEIILALNASVEGEATTLYLISQLHTKDVKVSRIAQGLSAGSDIKYADQMTLSRAIEGRTEINY